MRRLVVSSVAGAPWAVTSLLRAAGIAAAESPGATFALDAVGVVACGALVRLSGGVVARRDIGRDHPVPANGFARGVRAATRLLAPPVLVGAWCLSLAAAVLVLAPQFDVVATALVALAIAASVRAAAYYSEGFSETLATMLPFALLGLVVLDGVTRPPGDTDLAVRLLAHWPVVVYGLGALLLVEVVLRTAEFALRG